MKGNANMRFFYILIGKIKAFLRSLKRSVGYINGAETLPPPMTDEEEEELLLRIDIDPAARRTLVERNLRLVVYIAKKYENTGIGIEDLISIGTIGLIKAANTFRTDKNIKLATYASKCIENEILMYIRKSGNIKTEMSFDEPLNVDWDGNELLLSDVLGSEPDSVSQNIEQDEERDEIRRAVRKLNRREREIIELRFGLNGKSGMTQKEVADALNISQSYISRLEKKTIEKLRREIESKI